MRPSTSFRVLLPLASAGNRVTISGVKTLPLLLLACLLGWSGSFVQAADDLAQLKKDAALAIEGFKKADSTLAKHFDSAAGYAVFPRVSKGGLVFGGARGAGLVYEKGEIVGKSVMTQATFGAQIGGQVFREIIFFENEEALGAFKASKLEMSAQVGAVAAAEGVAEHAKYRQGVLIFTQPVKGLMGEASLGGQKFRFERLP